MIRVVFESQIRLGGLVLIYLFFKLGCFFFLVIFLISLYIFFIKMEIVVIIN